MQARWSWRAPPGPRSVGACLMHSADTLRRLGQLDAAPTCCRKRWHPQAAVERAQLRHRAAYLGDLRSTRATSTPRWTTFTHLEARADALARPTSTASPARPGPALSQWARAGEALAVAAQAVAMAAAAPRVQPDRRAARDGQILAAHAAGAEGMSAESALHYLGQAWRWLRLLKATPCRATVRRHGAPIRACGDYKRGLRLGHGRLGRARENPFAGSDQPRHRHAGHHQTEHARSEGYHHRELAESEARRAEGCSVPAPRSSAVGHGQEITGHLDAAAVFRRARPPHPRPADRQTFAST